MDQPPPDSPPDRSLEISPIIDIPWPRISLTDSANPIPVLVASADFDGLRTVLRR